MQVQSLGHEDPLEKEMATHSSILACKIPWTEEPGGLSTWDRKESGMTYWSCLPFPSSMDIPNPRITPVSPVLS